MKIEAMLLAAIVVGTLLGSASVAQAIRCYCHDADGPHDWGCKDYNVSTGRGIFGNWFRLQLMWNVGPLSSLFLP